jgi:hypothetical protein
VVQNIKYITLISVFIFIFSCKNKGIDENQLMDYIFSSENELIKVDSINDYKFQLRYQPTDLIISNDIKGKKGNYSNWDSCYTELSKSYENFIYFVFDCSCKNEEVLKYSSENMVDFQNKLSALSFDLNKYFSLITSSNDTLPLSFSYFPRSYNLLKTSSILISFPKEKIKNSDRIKIKFDDEIFGTGVHIFTFNTTDINNVPKLERDYLKIKT